MSALLAAGLKEVYKTESVVNAMRAPGAKQCEALMAVYEKMLACGTERFTVKPAQIPDLDQLAIDYPNFSEVIEDIRRHIALCCDSQDPLEIPPMLLLGEPSVGKTRFSRTLSDVLGTGYGFVSMASLTAGWILSGCSPQWKNAKPGKVFETLLNGQFANPLMLVDEVDKASGSENHDPMGAFYDLLEKDSAQRFVDEFVDVPIDAGGVIWVATANDERSIPMPILKRMNVYTIPTPNPEQARHIAGQIYREVRGAHDWGQRFPESPSADLLDAMCVYAPREMKRALLGAFGSAKIARREEVLPADFKVHEKSRPGIGFSARH